MFPTGGHLRVPAGADDPGLHGEAPCQDHHHARVQAAAGAATGARGMCCFVQGLHVCQQLPGHSDIPRARSSLRQCCFTRGQLCNRERAQNSNCRLSALHQGMTESVRLPSGAMPDINR